MNVVFSDKKLEAYVTLGTSSDNKFKKYSRDKKFSERLVFIIKTMKEATSIQSISKVSSFHYERLRYNGLSSIRIMNGRVERLIFREESDCITIEVIEINDTHYGSKR